MTKPTIVFDTNALISALMYPQSVSADALVKAVKYFQLVASDKTWAELELVTGRKKFTKYWSEQNRLVFLTELASMTDFHEIQTVITASADASDNKFLELAIDAKAKVIVSGDNDLRSLHPFQGVAIISPSDFLSLLK
jgi:uncharacterized protein